MGLFRIPSTKTGRAWGAGIASASGESPTFLPVITLIRIRNARDGKLAERVDSETAQAGSDPW